MRIAILFLFSLCIYPLCSQNISGKVIDETSQPIAFANVILVHSSDSSFVDGTTTGNDGNFVINNRIEESNLSDYELRISFIGYDSRIIHLTSKDIGAIKLLTNSKLLSEITITAPPPIIKMENRGLSVNIPNSSLQDIGTLSDILVNLPLVNKDNDKIIVFGKGIPLIYIDNRLIRDLDELEIINSSNIKKVTVVTNTGAEYDATVKSVIKIETLKIAGEGLSGDAMSNLQINSRISHNEFVNFNFRRKKIDVFTSFRFSEAKKRINRNTLQFLETDNMKNSVERFLKENQYSKQYRISTGLNYSVNANNSVGVKYDFAKNDPFKGGTESEMIVMVNDIMQEEFNSAMDLKNDRTTHYMNLYYAGKLTSFLSAKIDLDYATGKTISMQHAKDYRIDSINYLISSGKQEYDLYATKFTLTTPIWDSEVTYGGEYSCTINKQIFDIEEVDITEGLQSNNNKAKQKLFAAFAMFDKTYGKFSFNIGLRYERVQFKYFVGQEQIESQSRTYNNLYPSASISYNGKFIHMALDYQNNTERPSYYQLRNNIQYNTPYLYETGNPYLRPVKMNSLSLSLKWKDLIVESIYNNYKDQILFLPKQYSNTIMILQPINLERSHNISISAIYSLRTSKIWKPNLEVALSKDFLEMGMSKLKYNEPMCFFRLRNDFTLPHNLQIGLYAMYNTRGNSSGDYKYQNFRSDLYLSRSFLNNNLRINLRCNDLFNSSRIKRYTYVDNAFFYKKEDTDSRGLLLSVSYRFNQTKNKYKGTRASSEIDRL